MEENLKIRVILILLILNVIFILSTISLSVKLTNKETQRQSELRNRLEMEEKIIIVERDKERWDRMKQEFEQEIAKSKSAYEAMNEAFLKSQQEVDSLKDELNKLGKLKETLEDDLKDALTDDTKSGPGSSK